MSATIKLESSDEQVFEVAREIAEMSVTVKHMLDDVDADSENAIPLPNVSGKILAKVIEWATYHHENPEPAPTADGADAAAAAADAKDQKRTDDISPWDKEFCDVEQPTLFELILAANYLDIKPLLDLGCKSVANMIKGKSPEEIRKTFNIKYVPSLAFLLSALVDTFVKLIFLFCIPLTKKGTTFRLKRRRRLGRLNRPPKLIFQPLTLNRYSPTCYMSQKGERMVP